MMPPVADLTPSQRLASVLLGVDLEDWVAQRRDAGTSWRLTARQLREDTNGQVDVTAETLRQWYGASEVEAAS